MNIDIHTYILSLENWFFDHGITILMILVVTFFLSKMMKKIVTRVINRLVPRSYLKNEQAERRRIDTLITIIGNFLKFFIWIIAIFVILYNVGIPIAPLLTGAGILGVAFGFGSQSLVKDVIVGLCIIAENQFRINDFISVGEYSGTVESITLRMTKLRALDGTLHYIPNSEIKILSNKSRDYALLHLRFNVGYEADMDRLEKLVNSIGHEMGQDPDFSPHIIEPPQFLRIDDFLDSSLSIHIIGRVQPETQHRINGELRRRLKIAFQEHAIGTPFHTESSHNHIINK